MSIAALCQRLSGAPVPPVPPAKKPEGTENPLINQRCSPGSPGSPENPIQVEQADGELRRLWLVTLPEGARFSASCTPPTSLLEMSGWYPGATIAPEDEPEAAPEDEGIDTWLAAMGDPPPRGQSLTAAPLTI